MTERQVVLLVEDDSGLVDLIEALFQMEFGISTITATDGVEALRLVEEVHPNLILLDMMLPKLDGMQMAQRLKGEAVTRGIPIIGMSAYLTAGQAKGAGCDDFVAKPFDIDVLISKAQRYLQMGRPSAGA